MANTQTIAQWQQLLQALTPVHGWLYIGAGRGELLSQPRFAKVPRLLAVEADEHSHQLLAHATAPHKNWQAVNALVNHTSGPAIWHQLSREQESGLLPASALSPLWPNLTQQQSTQQPAVALSHLLAQAANGQEPYNWLTINCLPAAQLLQGLGDALQPLDMIEVRVTLDDTAPPMGTSLKACDELLLPQGFIRLATQEADNPLIGNALYGRDFKQQLSHTQQLSAELKTQHSALSAQHNELTAAHSATQAERDSLRSAIEEQKKRASRLEEENQRLQNHQSLMQEELVKTEAQINLIKELILPESGL
jgi:hypothetical protein